MLPGQRHENKTLKAKHYHSQPVVYQTRNRAKKMQQRDRNNSSFKQVQTGKILVALNKVLYVTLHGLLYHLH